MVMKNAVDQVDDAGQQVFFKISRLVDVPQYVKDAPLQAASQISQLPQSVFADPVSRKFPCHTKAATWMSQLYFLESQHHYAKAAATTVQGKIDKAAAYWHSSGQVKAAADGWVAKQSVAPPELSDADYAMVVTYDGDKKARHFPINNAVNVKAAADHLYSHRSAYPYDWRLLAARKILHKKAEHNAEIDPDVDQYLCKAAGFGTMPAHVAAEKLALRVLMIPKQHTELREKGAKLAQAVGSMKLMGTPQEMIKLARIVDRLDEEIGLRKYYDEGGVDTPEEMFFGMTEKVANEIKHGYIELVTGAAIPFNVLQQIPITKIAAVLGDDFVRAVTADDSLDIDLEKFARVAATLPLPDAQLLERVVNSAVKEAGIASGIPAQGKRGDMYDMLSDKTSAQAHFDKLGKRNDDYAFSTAMRHPQNTNPDLR